MYRLVTEIVPALIGVVAASCSAGRTLIAYDGAVWSYPLAMVVMFIVMFIVTGIGVLIGQAIADRLGWEQPRPRVYKPADDSEF